MAEQDPISQPSVPARISEPSLQSTLKKLDEDLNSLDQVFEFAHPNAPVKRDSPTSLLVPISEHHEWLHVPLRDISTRLRMSVGYLLQGQEEIILQRAEEILAREFEWLRQEQGL